MTSQTAQVAIQPLVGWPREAEQGRTYLITVDLRLAAGATWPYEREEYPIYCMLTAHQEYSIRPLGMSAVVLHRFGGSYGPARFLLTAHESAEDSGLQLSLLNKWGTPILGVPLPMRIVSASERNRQQTIVQLDKPVWTPSQVPAATVAREEPEDVSPSPDAAHCEMVLQYMIQSGDLVPLLGSALAEDHTEPNEDRVYPPDAEAIAAYLAEQFGIRQTRLDLPEIAQYVYVTRGRPDLYRTLKQILTAGYRPGPVHRFLARFPSTLEELGLEKRYQLIISANFDTTLEQAFDDMREPYDLAVYMASGPDKGKFVHFPAEGAPRAIVHPNSYTEFPIGLDYELTRTVIVKIHGAVDATIGDYRWRENYVITEDHYIDYLSKGPIESLVPVQILDKLRESHCLFLGYAIRDWTLRVFLKRIWEGSLDAHSWAVEPDPDVFEKSLWAQSNVDLYAADLGDYVALLQERLTGRARERANP